MNNSFHNKFYVVYDYFKLPDYIVAHPNTLCLRATGNIPNYRAMTTAEKDNSYPDKVLLANPSSEDLTFLTLLGVQYAQVTNSHKIVVYSYHLEEFMKSNG